MQIRSLGRRTDLLFARFSGSVTDRGNYTLVQTPSNPGYHWGNYIIFDRAPRPGDRKEWTRLFDREFPYYEGPHHYVFAWDCVAEKGAVGEFLDAGFDCDSALVLTAGELSLPPHPNRDIEVRTIESEEEWEAVVRLQTLCADPRFLNSYYEEFKRKQVASYRKMKEAGLGHWFGAFLGGRLVGDLGIFFEGEIARYQNVGTHPDYRKRGICGTLVCAAGMRALQEFGVKTLVMEADPDYHAARIYESVGFRPTEKNFSLSWWKGKAP